MSTNSSIADPWLTLDAEINLWASNDNTASFWWRDDDATAPGPKLDRLFDITLTSGLLLAVIPVKAENALAGAVASAPHVKVGQHGYAHTNHAERGQGQGAWELGLHRGESAVLEDLDAGRVQLQTLFGDDFIPVVVPPWNHVDPALIDPIAARGYWGISGFGPRSNELPIENFVTVNSHCDLIRWKSGAQFKGEAKTLTQLVDHLQARRTGIVDSNEPTGFLTHHIDLDEAGWNFCCQLVDTINKHPAAHWCRDVAGIFGATHG